MHYIHNKAYTLIISATEFGSVKSRKNKVIIYTYMFGVGTTH
jgi:hypothetical protein